MLGYMRKYRVAVWMFRSVYIYIILVHFLDQLDYDAFLFDMLILFDLILYIPSTIFHL